MNIQVSDASGRAVSDLSEDDFKVFDNHQAREIVSFHAIDGQAMYDASQIVILLDAVNSSEPALESEKNAIFHYLAESRKPFTHPTSFALWFNGHLSMTQPTTDRNEVGRAFVKMTKGVHSNDCTDSHNLGDPNPAPHKVSVNGAGKVDASACRDVHFKDTIAVLDGIAQQQSIGGGRTLLIWVGDGWPELTNDEMQVLASKQQSAQTPNPAAVLHNLRRAQVTVYSIVPSTGPSRHLGSAEEKVSTAKVSDSALNARASLHRLAEKTGGRSMAGSDNVLADLKGCIHDADWYYTVSFNAPPAQDGAGELHLIEVHVDRPGVQVRTIDSYYSKP